MQEPENPFLGYFGKECVDFILVQKSLLEDKLETFELIHLAVGLSRQLNIDFVTWLLVATLRQICNENEETE